MNFEPLLCTPTAWSIVCGRFAIHLFEGRVALEEMDNLQRIGERWHARHPGTRVEMAVVFPSDTRMGHAERTRMAQLIKFGEAHRAASATVILAEGLLGSMHRSMLTGMMMLAPAPHPAKVFKTIPEALTRIARSAILGIDLRFREDQCASITRSGHGTSKDWRGYKCQRA